MRRNLLNQFLFMAFLRFLELNQADCACERPRQSGKSSLTSESKVNYRESEFIEYKCPKDNFLCGSKVRQCSNGRFNGTTPSCIERTLRIDLNSSSSSFKNSVLTVKFNETFASSGFVISFIFPQNSTSEHLNIIEKIAGLGNETLRTVQLTNSSSFDGKNKFLKFATSNLLNEEEKCPLSFLLSELTIEFNRNISNLVLEDLQMYNLEAELKARNAELDEREGSKPGEGGGSKDDLASPTSLILFAFSLSLLAILIILFNKPVRKVIFLNWNSSKNSQHLEKNLQNGSGSNLSWLNQQNQKDSDEDGYSEFSHYSDYQPEGGASSASLSGRKGSFRTVQKQTCFEEELESEPPNFAKLASSC